MSGRRGWFSMRLAVRFGRRRWLIQFPPQRRRWLIALAVILLLMGYVVGAVPTVMVVEKSGLMGPYGEVAIQIIYAPLIWLSKLVPAIEGFFEAEQHFLEWLLGK